MNLVEQFVGRDEVATRVGMSSEMDVRLTKGGWGVVCANRMFFKKRLKSRVAARKAPLRRITTGPVIEGSW
jgi:hypothetical protein